MVMVRALFIAVIALVSAGCASDVGVVESADRGGEAPVMSTVAPADASLVVVVSNQSYVDQEVAMRVEIDGDLVTDRSFEAGSGHNYVGYPLSLAPGTHDLTVTAEDGTTLELPLDLPAERRWLRLDYRSGGDAGTSIGHTLSDVQPGVG